MQWQRRGQRPGADTVQNMVMRSIASGDRVAPSTLGFSEGLTSPLRGVLELARVWQCALCRRQPVVRWAAAGLPCANPCVQILLGSCSGIRPSSGQCCPGKRGPGESTWCFQGIWGGGLNSCAIPAPAKCNLPPSRTADHTWRLQSSWGACTELPKLFQGASLHE